MAVYYVLGATLVVWGLGLAVFGLLNADFPPSGPAGRALVGTTVLIVVATLTALLLSTSKEHPKEEAAAKAAEQKKSEPGQAPAQQSPPGATPEEQPSAPSGGAPSGKAAAQTVNVSEKEFSIALAGGTSLKAGSYKFAVQNIGKIQHDLAVEGGGLNETKTKLIDAGKSADLAVKLKPGKYTFYCSVPGHEQAGMKVAVTVK
jgi:plastocyanin